MTVATAEPARHSRQLQGVVLMVLAMLTILTAPIVFAFTHRMLPRPARARRPARPTAPRIAAGGVSGRAHQ